MTNRQKSTYLTWLGLVITYLIEIIVAVKHLKVCKKILPITRSSSNGRKTQECREML